MKPPDAMPSILGLLPLHLSPAPDGLRDDDGAHRPMGRSDPRHPAVRHSAQPWTALPPVEMVSSSRRSVPREFFG